MSNKPKIYAPCKAGCNWETVHKSDFDASASHIKQNIGEDGVCYLEQGKEYKIFAPKDESNQFTCSIKIKYYSDGIPLTHTFVHQNEDKYAESFVFRFLDIIKNEAATELTLVYEMAGIRYMETISGISMVYNELNIIFVTNATNVLLYNADATIVAKDGKTPFIGENGNWWIGDTDTGVSAGGSGGGSDIAVNKNYVDNAINSVKPYKHIVIITNESATIDISLTIYSYSNALFGYGVIDNSIGKGFVLNCGNQDFKDIITVSAEGSVFNHPISKPNFWYQYIRSTDRQDVYGLFIETNDTIIQDEIIELTVTDTIV